MGLSGYGWFIVVWDNGVWFVNQVVGLVCGLVGCWVGKVMMVAHDCS